jgi:DNA (cytosine-5)-methyltransferase 1
MTDLALFDAPPQPAQTARHPLTLHEAFTLRAIFGYLGSAPQHGATLTDLFAGAGGSSTGALQAGGTVKICANHWQTAVDIHAANHPLTDHAIVDLHQERPSFFPRTDILWASPECFTKGHLVTTLYRGQVPIEEIEVGEHVLTHAGNWRKVVRVQSRTADTVVVKGQGHSGIEVTPNHRFWARSSRRVWQNPLRDYRRQYDEPAWARVDALAESESLWATPTKIDHRAAPWRPLPASLGSNPIRAAWILGRWLGDGSLSFGRNHEVTISCSYDESSELGSVLLASNPLWKEDEKRTAVNWRLSDALTRDWLLRECGHGAAQKQMPSWVLCWPENARRALLDGYMSADGGFRAGVHRASTVSKRLAISIRLLAESLGHRVTVGADKRTSYSIEGRGGVARQQWILIWQDSPSERRGNVAFEDGIHSWSRVRSVEPGAIGATVYNIEVEVDHSYVLDGIVVANCTKWSPASGEKGPAIEEGLFEDPLSDDAKRRSRLLMFDVLRYIEHHRYHLVIVENVVDIATQAKYRTAWTIWRQELRALGYAFRVISLNSMHAQAYGTPAPQSRDRIYIVAWPESAKAPDLDRVLRPRSYCAHCDTIIEAVQAFKPGRDVGRYRQAYLYKCSRCNTVVEPYWLPALAAVDWSLPGERIGDRLKDKTRLRIAWGIARYWGDPFQIENAGNVYDASDPKHPQHGDPNGYYRAYPISDPFRTISTWGDAKALAVPVEAREGKQAAIVEEPLRTQTTRAETGLAQLPTGGIDAEALPFIAELYGTSTARPITAPAGTFTAGGNHHALVHRHNDGAAEMTTPASEYLRTLTTGGNVSLLSPGRDIPQHERRPVTDADLRRALEFLPEVRFRMFEPHEVAAGMAFPPDYVWQPTGLRHISKRNIVKAAGNAVTPPTARDLLAVSAESLAAG